MTHAKDPYWLLSSCHRGLVELRHDYEQVQEGTLKLAGMRRTLNRLRTKLDLFYSLVATAEKEARKRARANTDRKQKLAKANRSRLWPRSRVKILKGA